MERENNFEPIIGDLDSRLRLRFTRPIVHSHTNVLQSKSHQLVHR
jgi:hypothetical protein